MHIDKTADKAVVTFTEEDMKNPNIVAIIKKAQVVEQTDRECLQLAKGGIPHGYVLPNGVVCIRNSSGMQNNISSEAQALQQFPNLVIVKRLDKTAQITGNDQMFDKPSVEEAPGFEDFENQQGLEQDNKLAIFTAKVAQIHQEIFGEPMADHALKQIADLINTVPTAGYAAKKSSIKIAQVPSDPSLPQSPVDDTVDPVNSTMEHVQKAFHAKHGKPMHPEHAKRLKGLLDETFGTSTEPRSYAGPGTEGDMAMNYSGGYGGIGGPGGSGMGPNQTPRGDDPSSFQDDNRSIGAKVTPTHKIAKFVDNLLAEIQKGQ